jgi:hypothetical protein
MPTELDWAKLAAYIDGEGAILLNRFHVKHRNRKSMWLRVTVVNTDPRLPKWIFETFGVGRFTFADRKREQNHKQTFRWQASCKEAEWILRGCLEHFIIKREHAEIAIAFQETLGGPGITVSPEIRAEREKLRLALHALKRVTPLFDSSPDLTGPPRKRGPKPLGDQSPMGEIVQ